MYRKQILLRLEYLHKNGIMLRDYCGNSEVTRGDIALKIFLTLKIRRQFQRPPLLFVQVWILTITLMNFQSFGIVSTGDYGLEIKAAIGCVLTQRLNVTSTWTWIMKWIWMR